MLSIELIASAVEDLNDLVQWIARNDSADKAPNVLDRIEAMINSLQDQPTRRAALLELRSLDIDNFCEVFSSPIASSILSGKLASS